ncbi:hypothetical protein N7475_000831 [Penicillium sp. IBT 31633x]|nr:hypothetical protein N7475_000831 [Penicillium sp. IBT 31633x]
MTRPCNPNTEPPLCLDAISEWRAWQTLTIFYTVRLNRQIRHRWLLEQECMEDRPFSERFRPVIFLEAVPTLQKPKPAQNKTQDQSNNPFNEATMSALRTKAALLRARVEKGKELVSETERRMVHIPPITYPTHFCHTCIQDGQDIEVLLTKCGHRVCRTCLGFGLDENGIYECSICFAPTGFVARSPLGGARSCSDHAASIISKERLGRRAVSTKQKSKSEADIGIGKKTNGAEARLRSPTVQSV